MALGAQLPVRLELDVEKRLEEIAKKTGTSKSSLIRLLAKTFVDHVVSADGTISLPPNWSELLPTADGRSSARVREAGKRVYTNQEPISQNLNNLPIDGRDDSELKAAGSRLIKKQSTLQS